MNGLVEIEALSLAYRHDEGWLDAVAEVSFTLAPGEIFGIVGESGCGKSSLALQLLGYHHPRGRVRGGRVRFGGEDVLALDRDALDRLRGARISFVPQNPTTALNPAKRVGRLIAEVIVRHDAVARGETAEARVAELLRQVGLPGARAMARRYPHQLSGGQQQRVMIAMALCCRPQVVILDEPTTGLDVTTQKQIVSLLAELRDRLGTSMVYVTHDMGVIRDIADRVGVMYAGRMVEVAPTEALFAAPAHPYTRGLIASIPRLDAETPPRTALKGLLRRETLPGGCPFTPRCDFAEPSCGTTPQRLREVALGHEVACQRWSELAPPTREAAIRSDAVTAPVSAEPVLAFDGVSLRYGRSAEAVVRGVSFEIAEGETFGLVGESGSGKSTLARAASGLVAPAAGAIRFEGATLPGLVGARTTDQLRRIQYIFQNPDASLNPRLRVGEILARPLTRFFGLARGARRARVAAVLDEVRLPESYAARFPDQLSGGERQRVAIARALVAEPALMLCDEVLSGLDVSVQSSVLELLRGLAAKTAVAMLFISHDLAVVRHLARRVGVLYDGEMMETGETDEMFAPPFHPYTRSLLASLPGTGVVGGQPVAAAAPASRRGCAFAGRCPVQRGSLCVDEPPPWRRAGATLRVRCHIPVDELAAP